MLKIFQYRIGSFTGSIWDIFTKESVFSIRKTEKFYQLLSLLPPLHNDHIKRATLWLVIAENRRGPKATKARTHSNKYCVIFCVLYRCYLDGISALLRWTILDFGWFFFLRRFCVLGWMNLIKKKHKLQRRAIEKACFQGKPMKVENSDFFPNESPKNIYRSEKNMS